MVTYSDGSQRQWQGASANDPLTCLYTTARGTQFGLIGGMFETHAAISPRVRDSLQEVFDRGPRSSVQFFGGSPYGDITGASYNYVLTFEGIERIRGTWGEGETEAAVVSLRQTGAGNNFHQSVVRYLIDTSNGVLLRREVQLIAGSHATRGHEAIRVVAASNR